MVEVEVNVNSGGDGKVYFRYLDPDNRYRAVIDNAGRGYLEKSLCGSISRIRTSA